MKLAAADNIYYIRKLTRADAKAVCSWRYEGPQEIYNTENNSESIREFFDGTHFALSEKFGGPICAFINFGPRATIPVPEVEDIYSDESFTDFSVGLAPETCGKGNGKYIVLAAMELAAHYFPEDGFRATVDPDNTPAYSIYRAFGFTPVARLKAEVIYPDNTGTLRTKLIRPEILTAAPEALRTAEKIVNEADRSK